MESTIIEALEQEDIETVFNKILDLYGQEILQLCFSYSKNKTIAEDLTQEIFVKCYKSLHTYNGQSKLRTWIWRIAINHCKDHVKSWYSRNVKAVHGTFNTSTTPPAEDEALQKDADRELTEAVMDLPVKYREVIYMYYFEEMTVKEIAILLSTNANTVKTRLKRAKQLLKKRLGEDE